MKSHIYRLLFLAFLASTLIILSCEKDDITASTTEEKYQIEAKKGLSISTYQKRRRNLGMEIYTLQYQ